MATTSTYKINDCFRFDISSRAAFCRISRSGILCSQKISKNHHGNKVRHLKTAHRQIYDQIKNLKRKKKIHNAAGRIQVNLNIEKLHSAFVELVTKNGRPFSICEDSGMRAIIDPILDGIYEATGEKYTINNLVIKEKVEETYKCVRNRITAEIKNKPIGLLADISTKHNHSILGINIRYVNEKTIVSRTIGMVALTKSHTAANLHKSITDILKEYEVQANQLISFTTDNAPNIVNVTAFLNNDCEENMAEEAYDLEDRVFELLSNSLFGNLLDTIRPILANDFPYVVFISCGAHTSQLAVNDSLKSEPFAAQINFVRSIVKILRTPTISNELRSQNFKQAIIDHEIRWNYTYLMVNFFFEVFVIPNVPL